MAKNRNDNRKSTGANKPKSKSRFSAPKGSVKSDAKREDKPFKKSTGKITGKPVGQSDKKTAKKTTSKTDDIRLNKYIANAGVCSRRDADQYIAMGLVTVNGKIINEMGYKVKLTDEVRYDGARISPEKKAYVLLNKPKGFATTTSEGKGKTIMDLVANATTSRIKPIGRLGRGSTGLILLTNDDTVHNRFTNSNKGVPRLFQIELDKSLKFEDFKAIQEGFRDEGKLITVEEISYIDNSSKNMIGLKIKNTGNSILHTIFGHFNYEIAKVDCVAIGHLTKKDLPRGHWKHLTTQELNLLMMM
jgi:23S rRNA pseudouridine2605 synthase